MYVIGIDLSGPSNTKETSVVVFQAKGDGNLTLQKYIADGIDESIYQLVNKIVTNFDLVIGIDAPLSYNPGGGDRLGDKKLRKMITNYGMKSGSVMAPTLTRMVYLTLRGITIARQLESIQNKFSVKIIEVHPGAAMVLRGANLNQVLDLKKDNSARIKLLNWLEGEGMQGVTSLGETQDHYVAACSSALAAWKWHLGEFVWIEKASVPFHPYDFVC